MKEPKKNIRIGIRLDLKTKEELKRLAKIDKRNFSDFIRLELEAVIERNKKNNQK